MSRSRPQRTDGPSCYRRKRHFDVTPEPVGCLAVRAEDHRLEYADFEGVIPAGECGAVTVTVWNRGTWVPDDQDVDAAPRRAEFKFTLHGTKLKGSWVLLRTRSGYLSSSGRPAWLLIKHPDAYASAQDITTVMPRSVVSRRTLAGIAHASKAAVERAVAGNSSGRRWRSTQAEDAPRVRPRRRALAPGSARNR